MRHDFPSVKRQSSTRPSALRTHRSAFRSHTRTLQIECLEQRTLLSTSGALIAQQGNTGSQNELYIDVAATVASQLVFSTQPGNAAAGASLTPAVQVAVEDANGNVVTSDNSSVTVALGTNPGNGTLGGTLTMPAVDGVATFGNLSIDKVGTGYTLTAADAGLPGVSATSGGFNVDAAVTGVSSPTASGTYGTGTAIPITVTFSESVTVTGTPQLALNAGSDAVATYTSGSGTSTLTFTYTVAAGQNSFNLDYVSTTALQLNGGQIQDATGNAAVLTLPATGTDGLAAKNVVVNTTVPTVTAVSSPQASGPYGTGRQIPITVTFSEPVTVMWTPQLVLNAGSDAVAKYTSGSGTSTLTFTYTVAAGQQSSDLNYTSATALELNGGSIRDAAGDAAILTLPTVGANSLTANAIVVDTTVQTNVLWQNQSTGLVGVWTIQNAQNAGWTQLGQVDPTQWKSVGVGDFNGTGTAEVLWQNQTTGLLGAWIIQNNTNTGWVSFGSADPLSWKVVGVGDFNDDGTTDILWQNQTTGLVGAWIIQNNTNTGWVSFGTADPLSWKVVGVGDFNGSGTADVLWQNQSSGLVGAWIIQNAVNTGWVSIGTADPLTWKVAGVGDFNGDGTADILWQNQSTGLVGVWLIQNAQNAGWTQLGQADPLSWQVAGVGDFNGDGTADILWQNQSTGLVGVWLIQNVQNAGWTQFGQADPTTWQILGTPWQQGGSSSASV